MPELWPSGPGTQFDAFLFAQIGEDSNGLPLSVVSALARMGLDPWIEASELANLPAVAATQRLAGLFRDLPDDSMEGGDRTAVATRLIALLHRPAPRGARTSTLPVRLVGMTRIQPRTYALLIALFVFVLLLLSKLTA